MTTFRRPLPAVIAWLCLACLMLGGSPPFEATRAEGAEPADASGMSVEEQDKVPKTASLRERLSRQLETALTRIGGWAPIAFIALFVVACVVCVPTAFLTLAAGAVFGLIWGFVYVWIGAQLGASAAFLISRHLARDRIIRLVARRPLILAIEEAVSVEGWKIVFLARLIPGSPFFLLNYAFGLTRIRYGPYLLATALGMAPGTFLFIYLGNVGTLALTGRIRGAWDWGIYAAGLVALGAAVILIARRANRVLRQKLAAGSENGGRPRTAL